MAGHHKKLEEAKPFKFTGNYTRNFLGMVVVGIVLIFAGFGLTKIGGDDHSGHGTEHKQHGDDHEEGASDQGHQSSAGGIIHFTGDPSHNAAHGEDHNAAHDEDHLGYGAFNHIENGTWRRAYVHHEQTTLSDEDGEDILVDGKPVISGAHHHPSDVSKFGASLLGGTFWWLCVALFGVFFIAVGYLSNAGWYISVKRILEPFYRFLPVGALVMLGIFFIFGDEVWDWRFYELNKMDGENQVLFDTLLDGKSPFLNTLFILATGVLIIGLWTFLGHVLRQNSLKEEKHGGLEYHKKSVRVSAVFLPIFALGFSLTCFVWLMSLEPHWFSTIYAVYCFAGLFVSGALVTNLIAIHLSENKYLPEFGDEHKHDLSKFMFAFSVFWAYIWISQFLLIWYANIPEETFYYAFRFENYYFLFVANFVLNFIFPFLALMTRNSKRNNISIRGVSRVMIIGRFLDIFLLIAPGALGADWGFGDLVMMAGAFVMMGGIFLYIVFKGFEQAEMVPKKHPYYQESVNHSTGV